jgi:hypothetical protein
MGLRLATIGYRRAATIWVKGSLFVIIRVLRRATQPGNGRKCIIYDLLNEK